MRILLASVGIGLTLFAPGVCRADTNSAPPGKVVALVNAGAVSPELLAQLKELARKSLKVPFETVTIPRIETTNLLALASDLKKEWKQNYAAMIVLVTAPTSFAMHASFNTNELFSAVNVTAMSADNPEVYRTRVLKQVVRGAVFSFGLMPSKDPLCVSRNYRNVEDLDRMPAVLFPPWQSKFVRLASARGVEIDRPQFPSLLKAPPPPKAP